MRAMQRFGALFVLLATGPAAAATALNDIRVWASPDSTRVVLDLSAPANYNLFTLSGPDRVVIDFDALEADIAALKLPEAAGAVRAVRLGARGKGGLRVVLDVNAKVEAKGFLTPPNETYGHRLVVDLGHGQAAAPRPVKVANGDGQRDLVIAIDAGHGGEDPGAIGKGGTREKTVALAIARKLADRINAVIWFSDLHGYTTITDTAPPGEIIPLLNDYAAAVIGAVREAGGEVLKLLGDGVLAIFRADDPAQACRRAMRAEANLRGNVKAVNERRAAEGHPVTTVYLGLHIGEVFYGNIGSDDRLDFTVVGPAVNEASRIAAMCRSVDRSVVLSSEFVAATLQPERAQLVSVGRYALRGIGRAEELFTLDPGLVAERLDARG